MCLNSRAPDEALSYTGLLACQSQNKARTVEPLNQEPMKPTNSELVCKPEPQLEAKLQIIVHVLHNTYTVPVVMCTCEYSILNF